MINIYRITVKSKNDKLEYSIIKLHRNGEKYEQGKIGRLTGKQRSCRIKRKS